MNPLNLLNPHRLEKPQTPGETGDSPAVVVVLGVEDGGAHRAAKIAEALRRCAVAVLPAHLERPGTALESCLLATVRRVTVGNDVRDEGGVLECFRRGFVCGVGELLAGLSVTRPDDPVWRVFLECSARIDRTSTEPPSANLLARLREREASQERSVGHSINALVGSDPGTSSFDKWLGNTTRDAIGHCILEQANRFFATSKSLAADWPCQMCDRLFDAVDAFVRRFGFAEHRGMGGEIGSTLAEVFAECRG